MVQLLVNPHRFGSVSPWDTAIAATSPDHYWPCDEGTGNPVDRIAAHTTTLTGSLSWAGTGYFPNRPALDFVDDNTKYVAITAIADASDFTWQAAVRLDSTANVMVLVGNTDIGYINITSASGTTIQWGGGSQAISHGSVYKTDGTWHIIHLSRSGTTATLYVDGAALGSVTIGTSTFTVNNFGRYHSAGFSMDGRLSHVAHWTSALSASTIRTLAASWKNRNEGGPPTLTSQRAAWWAGDLALADAAAVASWVDRTSGFDAAQATSGARPTFRYGQVNGRPAVDFDGTDDILRYAAADAVSTASQGVVVAVIVSDDLATIPWASADEGSAIRTLRSEVGGAGVMGIGQRNNDTDCVVRGDDVLSTGTAYLFEWSSSGTAWTLRRNGDSQSLTVASGSNDGDWFADTTLRDNFTLGGLKRSTTIYFNGRIAYLAVADTELSGGDRTALQTWVTSHYGIAMV